MNKYEKERNDTIKEFIENFAGEGQVFYWDDMQAIGLFMADWANSKLNENVNRELTKWNSRVQKMIAALEYEVTSRDTIITELELALKRITEEQVVSGNPLVAIPYENPLTESLRNIAIEALELLEERKK